MISIKSRPDLGNLPRSDYLRGTVTYLHWDVTHSQIDGCFQAHIMKVSSYLIPLLIRFEQVKFYT